MCKVTNKSKYLNFFPIFYNFYYNLGSNFNENYI